MAESNRSSLAAGEPRLDAASARRVVEDAIARYFVERHRRVGPFVDRHFSLRGALALHRRALGWDIVKAPANLALAVPQVGLRLVAAGLRRAGAARAGRGLGRVNLLLKTKVAAEIEWLIHTELLELPFRSGARESKRDALAETILRPAHRRQSRRRVCRDRSAGRRPRLPPPAGGGDDDLFR